MAKLTIQRQGGFISFRSSAFKILIDGNQVETIREDETKEMELTNENHRLQISGRWLVKSKKILFDSNSPKIFRVSLSPVFDWVLAILIASLGFAIYGIMNGYHFTLLIALIWGLFILGLRLLMYLTSLGRGNLRVIELNALNP